MRPRLDSRDETFTGSLVRHLVRTQIAADRVGGGAEHGEEAVSLGARIIKPPAG
jgi:hypothetical protein